MILLELPKQDKKCMHNFKAVDLGISRHKIPEPVETYVPIQAGGLCKNACPYFKVTINLGKIEYYCTYVNIGISKDCI